VQKYAYIRLVSPFSFIFVIIQRGSRFSSWCPPLGTRRSAAEVLHHRPSCTHAADRVLRRSYNKYSLLATNSSNPHSSKWFCYSIGVAKRKLLKQRRKQT